VSSASDKAAFLAYVDKDMTDTFESLTRFIQEMQPPHPQPLEDWMAQFTAWRAAGGVTDSICSAWVELYINTKFTMTGWGYS